MTALARAGWRTLSLAEFAERVMVGAQHAAPLHQTPRSFLLSFDDGYESLATHAYPILADLGFSATTFVITDYVGKTNSWDVRYTWNRLPHLTWTEIEHWRALIKRFHQPVCSGVCIQTPDLDVMAGAARFGQQIGGGMKANTVG